MSEKGSQQPTRRWKRTAGAMLLLLVGGAIVNIAVAWGSAVRTSSSLEIIIQGVTSDVAPVWYISERGGWTQRTVAAQFLSEEETISHGLMLLATGVLEETQAQRLRRIIEESCPGLSTHDRCFVGSYGWPALAFRSSRYGTVDFSTGLFASVSTRGGILLNNDPLYAGPARILPFQPVASGFIINTLFYAILLWLLFFAPFAARRMIRRRRGQCEKCAYPISVSPVCTECGAAVVTSLRRSAGM